jgi:hypothetical protein
MESAYNPKRDGKITEYLDTISESGRYGEYAIFTGTKPYQLLWDAGHLIPDVSFVRIYFGLDRMDEHYRARTRDRVEGMEGPAHAGKPGEHDITAVLKDAPYWGAEQLRRL